MSQIIKDYFNQKAAAWDETIAEKDTAKLRRMARRLDIKPGSRVLDIGTGTGVFLPFIVSEAGQNGHITAMDLAEEMLSQAREKNFNGHIAYLQADAACIPLRAGLFDVVVGYSSFPHFQDKPRALAEINRVTRNGGQLVICHTSSRATINEIHTGLPAVANDIIPDQREMKTLLAGAGFTEIVIEDGSQSYLCRALKPTTA